MVIFRLYQPPLKEELGMKKNKKMLGFFFTQSQDLLNEGCLQVDKTSYASKQ